MSYMSKSVSGKGFDVFTHGYSSEDGKVACLLCVAINGYHSVASYKWAREEVLMNEFYPVVYVICEGEYKCTTVAEDSVKEAIFSVSSQCQPFNSLVYQSNVHCIVYLQRINMESCLLQTGSPTKKELVYKTMLLMQSVFECRCF